jgi:hypothetical protein
MKRLSTIAAVVFVQGVAVAQPLSSPHSATQPQPAAPAQAAPQQAPVAQPQQAPAAQPQAAPGAQPQQPPAAQPPAGQGAQPPPIEPTPYHGQPPAGQSAQPQPIEPAPYHTLPDQEARRIAAERWRARAELAQARAERAAREAEEEPEPRVRGDAGAALALGVSLEMPWYDDPGFDVFHDDDVTTRPGIWAGYDVLSLQQDLILAAEIGWGIESESESELLGGALRSELETQTLFAGVQLRWIPIPMLQPYARLAGGAALVDMELRSVSPDESFTEGGGDPFDSAVSPFGSLGLGVMLRTPTRMFENRRGGYASLSFGLMFEGGYTLAAPVEMKLDGEGPGERDIALVESELGELERSGPYARISGVARF